MRPSDLGDRFTVQRDLFLQSILAETKTAWFASYGCRQKLPVSVVVGRQLVADKWGWICNRVAVVEEREVCNRRDVETLKVFGMIDCVTFSERRYPQLSPNRFICTTRYPIVNLVYCIKLQILCMNTMSSASRAIVCVGKGEAAVKEVPVPGLREGHVLVKVKALGLNPTDWKSIYSGDAIGTRIGVCIGRSFASPQGVYA